MPRRSPSRKRTARDARQETTPGGIRVDTISFVRDIRLSWEGRTTRSVVKTSGRVERVLARPDGSALYRGNNVDALRLLSAPLQDEVTLAYMDPPFLTGRTFETRDQR